MRLDEAAAAIARLGAGIDDRVGAVHLEFDGPIARIRIDNPDSRNAITLTMMAELADAVGRLARWDGAVVVLCAADSPVFCSGGHLGQVRRVIDRPHRARTMALAMTAVLDGLLKLPQVSVAAIDGPAIGGGAEFATATDFRVLTPSARIHFVHGRLGIAPGWGGTARLAEHIGSRAALRVLAEAKAIDPERALAIGLADAVVDDIEAGVQAFVAPILANPPEAVRALKTQISAARRGDRDAEAHAFADVWGGPAHVAALDAMRGRRG